VVNQPQTQTCPDGKTQGQDGTCVCADGYTTDATGNCVYVFGATSTMKDKTCPDEQTQEWDGTKCVDKSVAKNNAAGNKTAINPKDIKGTWDADWEGKRKALENTNMILGGNAIPGLNSNKKSNKSGTTSKSVPSKANTNATANSELNFDYDFDYEYDEEESTPTPEMVMYEQQKANCEISSGRWVNNRCQCMGGFSLDASGKCVMNLATVEFTSKKSNGNTLRDIVARDIASIRGTSARLGNKIYVSGYSINQLPSDLRDEVLEAYYDFANECSERDESLSATGTGDSEASEYGSRLSADDVLTNSRRYVLAECTCYSEGGYEQSGNVCVKK
jgi:hypothetical protein